MGTLQRVMSRGFKAVTAVEPSEFPAMFTAFMLFFCVLGGYFAVRPVRETVATVLGTDRVADLFGVTWIASVLIIPVYGWLCASFRRSTFLPWIYGFIALSLGAIGLVFASQPDNIAVSQFYYVLISVMNLFVISVFWSFLLELFAPAQTKRLFPAIAAGGTLGALGGPFITSQVVTTIGNTGVLFMGAGMFVLALLLQRVLLRIWARSSQGAELRTVDSPIGGNPFAGLVLIARSPYLLGVATFVVLLASVNTILYLEQINLVNEVIPDRAERTQLFARIDWYVQGLTLLSQLVITGRVAKKWGVTALLTAVPVLMVTGFVCLALFHGLTMLLIVFVVRRVGEYAFVRPGRELLFGVVDVETKYKAKNTIDVPIYRGGDFVAAQLETGLSARGISPQVMALLGAGVAVVWAINGFLLGRKRESLGA
jgi:AAA family ATP:ADP antiporter